MEHLGLVFFIGFVQGATQQPKKKAHICVFCILPSYNGVNLIKLQ